MSQVAPFAKPALLTPREAYDLFADRYDEWAWQRFWHLNEWATIETFLGVGVCGVRMLDVGVGTGVYAERLSPRCHLVCGLDISYRMLSRARERLGPRALLVHGDASHLPVSRAAWDLILLNRVASHVENLGRLAEELAACMSTNGQLIVSDVSPQHRYDNTNFALENVRVDVQTFKHSVEDWRRAAVKVGLRVKRLHTLSAESATWLPETGLSSISRNSSRAVGFVLQIVPN
jgi:ubiquinone/menaquinone biosynthesis C-methylase UbiE